MHSKFMQRNFKRRGGLNRVLNQRSFKRISSRFQRKISGRGDQNGLTTRNGAQVAMTVMMHYLRLIINVCKEVPLDKRTKDYNSRMMHHLVFLDDMQDANNTIFELLNQTRDDSPDMGNIVAAADILCDLFYQNIGKLLLYTPPTTSWFWQRRKAYEIKIGPFPGQRHIVMAGDSVLIYPYPLQKCYYYIEFKKFNGSDEDAPVLDEGNIRLKNASPKLPLFNEKEEKVQHVFRFTYDLPEICDPIPVHGPIYEQIGHLLE